MKKIQLIMGMPIIVEINDREASSELFNEVFSYFVSVDEKFSTYKETSEISAINRGELKEEMWSNDMKEIFALSEETKRLTGGYFDIVTRNGTYDPSGLVKGWAILKAADILRGHGVKNFYIEAGGDIETSGKNTEGNSWYIGIQNPFNKKREVVKTVYLRNKGIATSGTYLRGQHIYNPNDKNKPLKDVLSLTVIGPNVYEADRFATAAFAMENAGIEFIERLEGFEGYQINHDGNAIMTSGFANYISNSYV